jgi:glucan-binding YG repeat protein
MAEGGKGDFGAARIFINSYNGKVYETGNSSDSLVVKFNNHLTVYNANGSSLAEAREISREVSDGFYIWYDTDSTKQYYYIKSNKFVKDAYVTDNTHNDSGNKNWYWMDKNGVWDGKTYSFVKSNSNWYFKCIKGSDYQAVSTWVTLDKDTYYFDGSGIMATDWKQIKNKWYYFNKEGSMQTGWVSAGGKKYYLSQSDGAMVTGTKTINGKKYEFNSDGSLK